MEGRLVLKNCSLFRADGWGRAGMALVVEEGLIRRVAPDAEVPVLPGDWEVACRGRLVMPGLVDGHARLVGGLLVPPSSQLLLEPPGTRWELERRLSEKLTAGDVEVLTRFAAARALREGITLALEHLCCPRDVAGALEAQARAAELLGLRLVTGHATQALAGSAAGSQVEANADFARRRLTHPLVRGALGLQSSGSGEDALLQRLARLRESSAAPVLLHLAEGRQAQDGSQEVQRLEGLGLLGATSVAACTRALEEADISCLVGRESFLALDPRAALAAEPPCRTLEEVLVRGGRVGAGTGGHGTLWDALAAAPLALRGAARLGRLEDPDRVLARLLVDGPAELSSRIFGAPAGAVEEGCLADLVVYDCVPALEPEDEAPYLLGQLAHTRVAWTVVGGRVTVREGQLLGADYVALAREAARVLSDVWASARVSEAGGSPGLGG